MREKARNNVKTSNADEARSSEQQKSQGSPKRDNSGAAELNALEHEHNVIYSQTAKAIISNINNNKIVLSRIVMDNGERAKFKILWYSEN